MLDKTLDLTHLEQPFHLALEAFDFRVVGGFAPYRHYLELLTKWNKAYNLTAIREPKAMLTNHILDSLAVSPYIKGDNCLDVGTGAGLPGLILAMANPGQFWTLLDSNIKKTRFVNQVIMELGLKNVTVVHDRVEEFDDQQAYDAVICRAYTSLAAYYQGCHKFIKEDGQLFAMKASLPKEEIVGLKEYTNNIEYYPIHVPGLDAERGLVSFY